MPVDPKSLENLSPEQRADLNLARLTRQLLSQPDTRGEVQRLLSKADPKLNFPEQHMEERITKVREESLERVKAIEEDNRKLRAELKQEKLHAKVTAAGLEVKDVVGLLEKHGMPSTDENYDMAIEVLRGRAALAEPTPSQYDTYRPPAEITKEIWADPKGFAVREAHKVIDEMRGVH
jgi:phosphoribosyl-ATP pyrophosphohydrolase